MAFCDLVENYCIRNYTSITGITSKNEASFMGPFPSNILAIPPTKVSGIFLIVLIPDLIGLTRVSIYKITLLWLLNRKLTTIIFVYRSNDSAPVQLFIVCIRFHKITANFVNFSVNLST